MHGNSWASSMTAEQLIFLTDGYTVKVENFDKGTIIFKEGEKGDCMYDILSGSIGIYDGYGTADEKLITTLTPNMFFGELGMIDNVERSCTAVVMEGGTNLEIITSSDLPELFEQNPSKVKMIFDHLSYRVRQLTDEYMSTCKTICCVDEARSKNNGIDEELQSGIVTCSDDLLVVRSLKL